MPSSTLGHWDGWLDTLCQPKLNILYLFSSTLFFVYVNPHPRIFSLWFLESVREGEKTERENICVKKPTSIGCLPPNPRLGLTSIWVSALGKNKSALDKNKTRDLSVYWPKLYLLSQTAYGSSIHFIEQYKYHSQIKMHKCKCTAEFVFHKLNISYLYNHHSVKKYNIPRISEALIMSVSKGNPFPPQVTFILISFLKLNLLSDICY